MTHPEPDAPAQRPPSVKPPEGEAQPASDGAEPIDDAPVPPLTAPSDTKGG
jgi:hypothetical protein